MKDGKLQVGIIGTGSIAYHHIVSYLAQDDVEVVALCDIVPGKAEKFGKKRGVPDARCYTDIVDMFNNEELDAVSVCTYNTTHAYCTIYSLEHGANVLLEKPMCVTLDESIEIMKTEKKTGKIVSVGFQPRFVPMTQQLKDVVQSGVLGDVYYVQTGGGRRRGIPGRTFIEKSTGGIGALGDIGCYSLDLVLNALNYPKPLTVSAYTSDFIGKNPKYYDDSERFSVDDFAAAFIRLEGGLIIDFRIAWAMHIDSPCDTIFLGKDGGLRVPATDCWNYGPGGALTLYHDVNGIESKTVLDAIENPGTDFVFEKKIRTFLDAIINGTEAPIPTSQIVKNQAILDGIVRSAELGREIEINIPEI